MSNPFFDHPILNSPYEYPSKHWELDDNGQPTEQTLDYRRKADFITPIPKPKKRRSPQQQGSLGLDNSGISSDDQQYDLRSIINELRKHVDNWRKIPNPNNWNVTPDTARLLQHWRHHKFSSIRPFFCQVEAVETIIWPTEVAPKMGKVGKQFLDHLDSANNRAYAPSDRES